MAVPDNAGLENMAGAAAVAAASGDGVSNSVNGRLGHGVLEDGVVEGEIQQLKAQSQSQTSPPAQNPVQALAGTGSSGLAPVPSHQTQSQGQVLQQSQQAQQINGLVHHEFEREEDATGLDEDSNGSNDSMRELEDLLKKLNPLAKEFVPPSRGETSPASQSAKPAKTNQRKNKNGYNTGKRRFNNRTSKAQREDSIRRTVYVSDIDQQVTEEQLAALFITCGQVVDCRVCGDPNSVLRFAFVEFTDEEGARAALNLAGTMLGYYPVRVLPSKTAIVPVNPTFLPRSEDERAMCARTIYCTNIDKKVSQAEVKLFFETLCGEVSRLRLLGDYHHSTRIAFVEFVLAESAMAALNCSGAILGTLPIRVSPSKTPVRPRSPRPPLR